MNFARALWSSWCDFFFTPSSTLPLCLFRVLYGALALEAAALIAPDLLTWYGVHGTVRPETAQQLLGPLCLDLILYLPQNDNFVIAFFALHVLSALAVCLGLGTRFSSIVLFFTLSSFHFRNPMITNSGDDLLRVYSFFMMFAASSDHLSLDSLLRKRFGKGSNNSSLTQEVQESLAPLRSLWPQRLIQIEITLLYMQYFVTKIVDPYWLDGTAVYYVLASKELERFPIFLDRSNILISRFLTYYTLFAEFALCAFIWVKQFRYWVLLAGLILHIGLDYTLNIPIFQQVILASYVLFIDPSDLERFWCRIRARSISAKEDKIS